MTTDINDALHIPVHPLTPGPSVAIVADGDLGDVALKALIDGFGYRAALVDLSSGQHVPSSVTVVIVRSIRGLSATAAGPRTLVGIGVPVGHLGGIEIPDTPHAAEQLRRTLRTAMARDSRADAPVHLSPREHQVVVTYTLGATVKETARQYFIAETTVRSHFRRVMTRYAEAGRPVNNKSQLLIALIVDGWVDRARLTQ
ncbi:LuxR C-terminal-related transcriptional regulator [Gordonia sp. NPDC003424]